MGHGDRRRCGLWLLLYCYAVRRGYERTILTRRKEGAAAVPVQETSWRCRNVNWTIATMELRSGLAKCASILEMGSHARRDLETDITTAGHLQKITISKFWFIIPLHNHNRDRERDCANTIFSLSRQTAKDSPQTRPEKKQEAPGRGACRTNAMQ
jgi:hypothetical protein